MEEENDHTEESTGIVRAKSAYMFFSKEVTQKVRQELLKEGKDASLGVLMETVSRQWRELSEEGRQPYEALAQSDRYRYQRDCQLRDEEVARQQEERRRANNATETDTKLRGSTLAYTESLNVKESSKRTREISQEEHEEKEKRKALKKQELDAIAAQHNELKKSRIEQAEARLKYLLNQSDIFAHFGVGKKTDTNEDTKKKSSANDTSESIKSKRRGGGSSGGGTSKKGGSSSADLDDMDEDEREMFDEEADDEGDDSGGSGSGNLSNSKHHHQTILTKQPSLITGGTLRAYQLEGLNWMIRLLENGINGILADEMGLGKTLQSISIIAYMKEYMHIPGPHLVMVPKSTLSNWCNEFRNFCPSIRVLRFHGSKEERQEIIDCHLNAAVTQDKRDWDVLITTYEIVNLEKNALIKLAWRYLIIDEAHRLKNDESQFSQTVRLLNTQYRLLLTGTPLQNNLHELWALLNFLLPDVFADSDQFDEWFNLDVDDTEAKQRIISQLHKILRPFMLRRLKADVEKSLPPKTETILFTGMSAVQRQLYTQILKRDIDTLNGSQGSRTAILNIVMQLRKCCNHPYLFPGIEDRSLDPLGDHLHTQCGKMVLLDKLLAKMKERGHRVLIFSQMTRMLDILEDYLISKHYLYCRIDGNTSYDEREDRIADFNSPGSDKFIFLLSTRAGGLGINLQTADTVIIYDSDWNPQADLQAQDRAHRIGQKKPVQVFRLVTDETVEVKVVERAQQKLKLDAMVVQQGRLMDKDRKLSKQELLETIKFGADKVFRSKESTITDDDIDLILQEGKKRTEAMTEKLQLAEKGDLYNFSLDASSTNTQVFEGKDYADRSNSGIIRDADYFGFIDIGKRERKVIASYADTTQRATMDETVDKRPKIPRHLKLPKMDEWQFYDKIRLIELHEEECKKFEEMIDKGETPQAGSISKFHVLDIDKQNEKNRLLEEAFGSWTRVHFNNFIKFSAKYGRLAYDKIAKDVGRPVEEVKRYSEVFWVKGPSVFSATEWDRVVKQIEKGEKKLEEIQRLTLATKKLILMFTDPWEQLTFRHVGNQGRIYNAMEDRYLLCLTHIHGYGNWDLVRSSIRRCDRFRFDFYIQACTAEAIGKRCEILMRAAEREVNEIEKKKQAVEALSLTTSRPKDLTDANKAKLEGLLKEIKAESLRLAQARAQLQTLKSGGTKSTPGGKGDMKGTPSGKGTSSNLSSGPEILPGPKKKGPKPKSQQGLNAIGTTTTATSSTTTAAANSANTATSSTMIPTSKFQGPRSFPIPDQLLPELCKFIKEAGPDGIGKVVEKFANNHPTLAKRQIEIKINELAVKEKRPYDTKQVWYILPKYEHYLTMENYQEGGTSGSASSALPADSNAMDVEEETKHLKDPSSASKKGKKKAVPDTPPVKSDVDAKKRKRSDIHESGGPPDVSEQTPLKTKATSSSSSSSSNHHMHTHDDEPQSAGGGGGGGGGSHGKDKIKKAKLAFAWFVKDKRPEVEKKVSNTEELKVELSSMWDDLSFEERAIYQKKEQDDKLRYERELAAWQNSQK